MIHAFHNFQVSQQGAQIQTGGCLADTAAIGFDSGTAVVTVCLFPAGLRCAFTQGGIVGEDFAGHQHDSVDRLAGQLQIDVTIFRIADRVGCVGTQYIPEQQ